MAAYYGKITQCNGRREDNNTSNRPRLVNPFGQIPAGHLLAPQHPLLPVRPVAYIPVALEKHIFSEPWDESDVILVVEGERFHVHRLLLSMHSPVFKAMFNSDFKEKDAGEIPLPGKKAKEFLDFLYQVYPHQPESLTMENVKHILRLADEYQMKRVIQSCGKFLLATPKSTTNAMPILLLAQAYGLGEVCDGCLAPLAQLSIEKLKGLKGFQMMDGESTRKLLLPLLDRAEKKIKEERASAAKVGDENLKSMIRKVYPQFKGMIECALYFALGGKTQNVIDTCPAHFTLPMKKELQTNDGYCSYCHNCIKMTEEIGRIAYGTSPSIRSKENLAHLLRDMAAV